MISTFLSLSLTLTLGGSQAPNPMPVQGLPIWTQTQAVSVQSLWTLFEPETLALASPCELTASLQASAQLNELEHAYMLQLALAANTSDPLEAAELSSDALDELLEGLEEAEDVYDARKDLCGLLGPGSYEPDIDPADFSPVIDNPLLPYKVGASWTYEKRVDDELEIIQVDVLPRTKVVAGVTCAVVKDTVTLNGELLEDTRDYYAQDKDGNVWYFGELSVNYEEGELSDIEGSWIAGEDGAHPGIVMFAQPVVGTTYRQEYLLSEAEDAGTILSMSESVSVPAGSFNNVLQTADFSPMDPDTVETKHYVRGIGQVLELKPDEGEKTALIAYSIP